MILKILLKELNKAKFFLLFWIITIFSAMSLINLVLSGSTRGALTSLVGAAFVVMGIFISISLIENYESHHRGYDIMLIMPVKLLDIIMAKFLALLIIMGTSICSVLPFVLAYGVEPLATHALMISINLALVIGGLFHLGIARLGFEKCLNILLFGAGTAGFVVLLILQIIGRSKDPGTIENFALLISKWPVLLISILTYFLLMLLTVKVKARYPNR
ncbi:hypothetical protein AT15_01295 [Kosmotoga arenicorallina S304]|uniref:Uncharacterized protein n=1 Tax=Kosmotoga arenicorallina S304 TaxID=1453497 RepID=A0A176K087_9BACT|nr:ABC-2 transporter permease [Kosmotoga arenicorallina]OAA29941.1 hypothetical protein AT15_01295 [Kosmotoga arenicorallina S304]